MNCFTQIATNPEGLSVNGNWQENLKWFKRVSPYHTEVIFAWGNNKLVKKLARDVYFEKHFPKAKCLGTNLDGSPKHPLYLPYSSRLLEFNPEKV